MVGACLLPACRPGRVRCWAAAAAARVIPTRLEEVGGTLVPRRVPLRLLNAAAVGGSSCRIEVGTAQPLEPGAVAEAPLGMSWASLPACSLSMVVVPLLTE